jgi:Uncharacterised protein family (UPF0236)
VRPFCQQRGVRMRGTSQPLQRAMVDFGADEAFAGAAAKLLEHYGVEVPVSRVREVCLRHARRLAATPVEPARTLAAQGPAAIVAEADGTMIPVVDTAAAPGVDRRHARCVRYQEMRLLAAQAQGEVRTHYAATFGGPEEAGARWSRVVRQAGWAAHSFIHGVGDGAPWIAEQFRQHFGAHGRYTLDLFHDCEYLAAAAPDPANSAPFVREGREALRDNRAAEVLAALAARIESPETPDADAPVRCAHRYLSNRLDQLDYRSALERNLPVGSGLIESGHRHVLQARLKLSGPWWRPDNAHAMAQLRTCRANGLWLSLWRN